MRVFKIVLRKTFFNNIFLQVEKYSAPMSAEGRDNERQGRDQECQTGDQCRGRGNQCRVFEAHDRVPQKLSGTPPRHPSEALPLSRLAFST